MAQASDSSFGASIDRSERPGRVGLLLALAALLVGAALSLSFLTPERAQPLILLLLALLGMAGVFFLFAVAFGAVQFSGQGARNDLTKAMADAADEGLVVVEEDSRIVYANEAYLLLAGSESFADLKPVERLFVGTPEVSEAIYRLAQAAREGRPAAEEIRVSPSPAGGVEFGWFRVRVRPVPRPGARAAALWSIADITHERESQESVFRELQHAIDYLDHAPAGFLSIDASGAIVYMNATLAAWLGHDLAKVGSGGLRLSDVLSSNGAAMMAAVSGDPGEVRTETFDVDLRRRGGQALPVRIFHRVVFGEDGRPGASRTLVLNRSAGEDVDEGQRAAEVRFARFFNSTPIAIATLNRAGRVVRSNGAFARLFGTLPRTGGGGEGRSILETVAERDRPAIEQALTAASEGRGDLPPLDFALTGEASRSARGWLSPVRQAEAGAPGREGGAGRPAAARLRAHRRGEPLGAGLAEPGQRGRGGGREHHALRARHHRAAPARAAIRPGAEDAGRRPARRRRRARLQQRAAGDHRLLGPAAREPPPDRSVLPGHHADQAERQPGGEPRPPAPGLLAPADPAARGAEPWRRALRPDDALEAPARRAHRARPEARPRPVVREGGREPVRAGDRQPRGQRPRRNAGWRQALDPHRQHRGSGSRAPQPD